MWTVWNLPSPGGYTTLLAFPSDVLSAPQGNILFQPFLLVDAWEFGWSYCNTIFVCKEEICEQWRLVIAAIDDSGRRNSYIIVERRGGTGITVTARYRCHGGNGIWAKLLLHELCMQRGNKENSGGSLLLPRTIEDQQWTIHSYRQKPHETLIFMNYQYVECRLLGCYFMWLL
jgi:hypothetical protein